VNELYANLAELTGTTKPANHGPAKPGEQMRSVLDGRALRTLATLPEPVRMRDGLRQTVEWFRGLR